jgi:fumarylacetoacetase
MPDYNPTDPSLRSWVAVAPAHDFPIQNLPFGIFEAIGRGPRPAVAIGDHVLDLAELGLLEGDTLNALMERGPAAWRNLRARISNLLRHDNSELRDDAARISRALLPARDVALHLPCAIGDYVDFYSSIEHATNVGRMFRDPSNPLLPNWRWLPVGYHGKSGTVHVSGTPVRRPSGQLSANNETALFAPSKRLDIELETGFFVGRNTNLGEPLTIAAARDAIFGMVLLNDWSARDIQRWEYQPLGPFLGKSFLTSISPWVVTMDALEPFRVAGPAQEPPVLPYLAEPEPRGYDITLEVWLQPAGSPDSTRICRTNFRTMYWSMTQQIAHMTSNGASVRCGDLCGSGTVSGPTPDSFGSLLELAWNGAKPLQLPGGIQRTFLEDGDTVILKGYGEGAVRIGFGEVSGTVVPA